MEVKISNMKYLNLKCSFLSNFFLTFHPAECFQDIHVSFFGHLRLPRFDFHRVPYDIFRCKFSIRLTSKKEITYHVINNVKTIWLFGDSKLFFFLPVFLLRSWISTSRSDLSMIPAINEHHKVGTSTTKNVMFRPTFSIHPFTVPRILHFTSSFRGIVFQKCNYTNAVSYHSCR